MRTVKFLKLNEGATREEMYKAEIPVVEFMNNILNDGIFQSKFFGHAISQNEKTKLYKFNYDRRQVQFNNCFDSSWELTDERREAMISKINSFTSDNFGKYVCDNSYDSAIQSCGRDITGNAHFTVLTSENGKHPIQRHLFTIKLPLILNKNTVFKEGSKVLFINYMIHTKNPHLSEAINAETYPDFIKWINSIDRPGNKLKGMTDADFKKMLTYFTTSGYETVKEFIKAYQSSCDLIYKLAGNENSFVTRDEGKYGILRQFKTYVANMVGAKPGKKAHPADLIMVGSRFDKLACAISNNTEDNAIYCAISLKEHVARWGKATSAITNLQAQFENEAPDLLKKVRDEHLYDEIKKLKDFKNLNDYNDKTDKQLFDEMCSKFTVALPKAEGYKKVVVNTKNIANIDALNNESTGLNSLSEKAISNLFFTALIFSHDNEYDQKAFIAYLINSSLQLGTTPYYVAKDGQKELIEMDSETCFTSDNIESAVATYTASGDIKVTNVIITLKVDDNFTMPTTKKGNKVELDIRQGGRGKRNTVIEFK